jgi:hypothetical protein
MTRDEPDWSALPHRPLEFFGLSRDFDVEALKRAYTRLIRRFKPEHHPEEFQRIRGAFEQLEAQLRAAQDGRRRIEFRVEIDSSSARREPPSETGRGSRRSASPSPETPRKLLERLGAPESLAALQAKSERTPQEWCALALLTETLTRRVDETRNLLIDGLAQTRGARELVNLLGLYLREMQPTAECDDLLRRLAARAEHEERSDGYPTWQFWELTAPLWPASCSQAGLESTLASLAACTQQLGPSGRSGELQTLLVLRRHAALTADDKTLADLDRELEENLRLLPPWAVTEYDIVSWLTTYRRVRAEFRTGAPLREQIDQALVAIIQGDALTAERAVVGVLVTCRERRREVLDAFPAQTAPRDADRLAVSILSWYASQLREDEDLRPSLPSDWVERCADHLRLIATRGARSRGRRALEALLLSLMYGPYLALGLLWGASRALIESDRVFWGAMLVAVGSLIFIADPLKAQKLEVLSGIDQLTRNLVWRTETARFLAQTRIPLNALVETARAGKGASAELSDFPLANDTGLQLISLAAESVD